MSMTAFQTGPNTFAGTLYRTTGPPLDAVPFDPNQVQRIEVGNGTLTFSDGNNGTFAYTVNGITQTKSITREVFGAVPTCTWGGLTDLALATNYQDLWWAAGGVESGWGVNFSARGRRHLRHVVHLRLHRRGAAALGDVEQGGAGDLLGNIDPDVRTAVLCRAVQSRCGDANARGHRHGDVQQRQRGDILLPGERRHEVHDADEVDRAAGVPAARNSVPLEDIKTRAAQDVVAVLRGRLAKGVPGVAGEASRHHQREHGRSGAPVEERIDVSENALRARALAERARMEIERTSFREDGRRMRAGDGPCDAARRDVEERAAVRH